MSDQATLSARQGVVTMMPQAGVAASLIASGTLTADFNDNISTVVGVIEANYCTLLVKHTGGTSQANGYPVLLVMFANTLLAPAIGDDSWFAPVVETADTAGSLPGTVPTGADFAADPNWTPIEVTQKYWKGDVTQADEVLRARIPIDCSDARWMYVAAIQQGDVTNFGTIAVDYALSV